MICKICKQEVNGLKGLSIHLKKRHKLSDIEMKNYYDIYLIKENEGKCYFCENEAIFFGFSKGYHKICSSKECLGKTRATGTHEFLMYKYNLNESDALKLMNERATDRGKIIKKSLDKKLAENPNFHKEKSHQSKDYWIKRGLNEENAKEKAKEVMKMIHIKAGKKRKENPKMYDDILPTQLKYWLKKGFNEVDAKKQLKKRQLTFTLETCIKKHGFKKGTKIYNNRQIKWSKNIKRQYKAGKFSKVSKSNYSKPELELFENVVFKMNLTKFYSGLNENQFFRRFKDKTYSYDFVYGKKIIELNGEYWHCNPKNYKKEYYHKHRQMTAEEIWNFDENKIKLIENKGYEVLIIWENDYKQNTEMVVKRCIEFLKNS